MMDKSGFGYRSTAEQVTKDVDASGLTALVTGSTSGIGTETARVLALRGAHVYLAARSEESATATKEKILKEVPNAKLDILAPLDLGSLTSVRKAAEKFLSLNQPLNLLINNAGIMMPPFGLTEDGIEKQFGINSVGHFLLTHLLLDKLKDTANETGLESRIVTLSSSAMKAAPKSGFDWDHISDEKGYGAMQSYGLSKLANLYYAQELAKRLEAGGVTNVTINSVHPGAIFTGIGRSLPLFGSVIASITYAVSFPFWKSIPQGAATTCFVALHPSLKGMSGKFFTDSNETKPSDYNPIAEDEEQAKKVWDLSVQLIST